MGFSGSPSERRWHRRKMCLAVLAACLLAAAAIAFWCRSYLEVEAPFTGGSVAERGGLTIVYPLDETLFPPEIAAPRFRWRDENERSDNWTIAFDFHDGQPPTSFSSRFREWTPLDEEWVTIQRRSRGNKSSVRIVGVRQAEPNEILSEAGIRISTSTDEVGAPLFFREVNLPFREAVKDPAKHIRWRFGPISSKAPPPIVLDKLPVCGNCHSFSADGTTLAMEVDSGSDKGSYAIAPVGQDIILDKDKLITWSDYKREDQQVTFGLLCQVSPDGRYIAGTVKDRALAVAKPELEFSQLFFPIKGYLAIYDRQKRIFFALPGADDPRHVQTNATWSPDGKYLVFARSREEALDPPELRLSDSVLVPVEYARDFISKGKTFLYDLYRISFNDGKGGKATPIPGASNNGTSNYFAKFSPDGNWIVYCRAKSFMLLQPDSELYILPADGGEARRLQCNTRRMNSWHSWSPNSRWLVFSSKANGPFTQLFLTHIDEEGCSSPPVVLGRLTPPDRAANIPEFVNAGSDAIQKIHEQFLDDESFCRAAEQFQRENEDENAIRNFELALQYNSRNLQARMELGTYYLDQGRLEEAQVHLSQAIEQGDTSRIHPRMLPFVMANAHCNLGMVLAQQRRYGEAIRHCREALSLRPEYAVAHRTLGALLLETGEREEGKQHLTEAARLDPRDSVVLCQLADALLAEGKPELAALHYQQAIQTDRSFLPAILGLATIRATSLQSSLRNGLEAIALASQACEQTRRQDSRALGCLAAALAESGRFNEAISVAQEALRIASDSSDHDLSEAIGQQLKLYMQHKPFRCSASPATFR